VLDDSNSTSGTIIYDGSAIIVDSRSTGYAGNVNINVTGGTVESCYSTAIREIGEQDKPNMTRVGAVCILCRNEAVGAICFRNSVVERTAGNGDVAVTGGTVESCYSTAIREIGEQDKPNMTQLTKLNITGGSG